MKRVCLHALILFAAVWGVWGRTGGFDFIRLDDHDYTFRCPFVKDGFSAANAFEAFTNARHGAIYMPATYVSYMLDVSFFGKGMGPHHLVNVGLHGANAVLVFLLLLALFSDDRRSADAPRALAAAAACAAALWALHPQRVEPVAWIACRKELLMAFFTLLGLIAWRRRGVWAYAGALVCAALACLSKPTAMCFPFLALAVDAWTGDWKTRRLRYVPLVALAVATGAVAVYSQMHPEGMAAKELFYAPLWWRLLNAAVSLGLYLFQAIVPVGFHIDYRAVPGGLPLHAAEGLGALVAAIALAAVVWRKCPAARRLLLVAVLWLLASLAPTLGIFGSFGEQAYADRFAYLPMAGLAILLCGLAVRHGRWLLPRGVVPFVGCGVLVGLAGCSACLTASFRNDRTVFARVLACDPDHGRALAHVGNALCAGGGKMDEGIALLRRAQAQRPRFDVAAQLAYALALRGRAEDFAEVERLTDGVDPLKGGGVDAKGQALEARGRVRLRQRRWDEAIACFTRSIAAPQRFYSAEDARLALAIALFNSGRHAVAEKAFKPLAESTRPAIRARAREALDMLRSNPSPRTQLFL